jgi:tetratricopeptide (TPR) repeat protein
MFSEREVRVHVQSGLSPSTHGADAVLRSFGVTLELGSRRPLPHLAYLEALADCEEDTPRWQALTAGYAALQLFDLWVEHDLGAIAPSDLELRRVRKRLELVPSGDPIRRCLSHLVDVMERARAPRGSDEHRLRGYEAGRVLAAYGKLLQYESSWSLSRDVHETLIDYARGADDVERLLDSMLMVAFCHRMLGQLDVARDAYTRLRGVATEAKSEQYLLLSELGFAKIAIERGNLPAAAGMLDQILIDSRTNGQETVRAKALMDRARVANQLGDLTAAAVLGHQALECSTDPMERDRILVNLGMTLTHMGLWSEARDAYLVVTAAAQEVSTRWLAHINLMELAYLEGSELQFEQYRRAVSGVQLPPYIEAVFHETCANGFCRFGRLDEATVSFRRMLDVAERHSLHEFVIKAASALEDVARVKPPLVDTLRRSIEEQPREVATVASSIARMRAHAGL